MSKLTGHVGFDVYIEAFSIFAKYEKDPVENYWITAAEHDVIYICGKYYEISNLDKKRLEELGFIWNDDDDTWFKFT